MSESLFQRNIRWVLGDVEACVKAEQYVGAMRQMCCIIDGLSGYYLGTQADKVRKVGDEFTKFLTNYFSEFERYSKYPSGEYILLSVKRSRESTACEDLNYYEILYHHFRCGLVHNLLMKENGALIQGVNNDYFYSFINVESKENQLWVNVIHFYHDFVKAILTYKDDVINNRYSLRDRYIERHLYMTGIRLSEIDF